MELLPGIHWIQGKRSNIYLWERESDLILVDTGMPGDAGKVKQAIHEIGRQPGDLSTILITHADADHAGSSAELQAESGATIYASKATAELLREGKSPKHMPRVMQFIVNNFMGYPSLPSEVIHTIAEGEVVPGIDEIEVLATPGHTLDHLSFYNPVQGILFAGDALNTNGDQLNITRKRITADQEAARLSAMKLLRLHPATIACGHGRPMISHDANALMMLYRQLG